VVSLAMRRIPASPSHLSEIIEFPVTTLRLTGVQRTWLNFGCRHRRPQCRAVPCSSLRAP
jgi:hypothetical protein